MNAIEVITERIESHVEGWVESASLEEVFSSSQEVAPERDVTVKLYTGTVQKGSGLRSELIPFTVYVYDDPADRADADLCAEGYTQVTVNFPGGSYDPINYLYWYESGEELRLTSN